MRIEPKSESIGKTLLFGSLCSAGWYTTTSALLSGAWGTVVPIAGAIAIAGLVPALANLRRTGRYIRNTNLSLVQRIQAFDEHAAVNIVGSDHMISEVNERLIELTGYSREELVGKPVDVMYGAQGAERCLEIRASLMRGEAWQGETPVRHADGHTIITQTTVTPLTNADGEWVGSIAIRTDVTGAYELIAHQETAETLHELRDDIWIVDAETERFSYMNKVAASRFGLQKQDYLATRLDTLSDGDEIRSIVQACRNLRSTGESTTNFEMTLRDVPFYVTVKYLHRKAQGGRYLILLSDITESVVQAQNRAAFVSTVSHELRSPLTSIKGSMGLLLSKSAGELPERAVALLEIAHRNADRLVLIINDILDLEKISQGQMDFTKGDVDLCALVREAYEANITLQQRFSLNFEISGDESPLWVHTDPNRIIQVLNNFLSNACKFSKPSGKVSICLHDEGDQVRVCVKDEGRGIPPADQKKVFQRFADMENSDRAAKGGTGLGLSICKAIIDGLDGTIGFDTREGAGTTFYFVLPKVVAESMPADTGTRLRVAS